MVRQAHHEAHRQRTLERQLQVHDVVPAVELEADRLIPPDMAEAELLVDSDGVRRIGRITAIICLKPN